MPKRFDYAKLNTVRTDEGYLIDSPIVGRIGIQEYRNADGSIRRELRLPEHVFEEDSLSSFKGKPVTNGHPGHKVTSKVVRGLAIGTVLTQGKKDGDHVTAEIIVHDPDAIGANRELSLGYDVTLDETPGVWNGEKYDAIQTRIRIDHLAVVFRGRAGVARLNVDGNEDFETETETKPKGLNMPKIRLDTGIEYEAPAEVVAAIETMRGDAAKAATALAKAEAERDAAKTKADGLDAAVKAAREAGRADALARNALDTLATGFKVDSKGKTDRQVKEAVIRIVRKNDNLDLSAKSDEYVNAAFELACEETQNADEAMAQQRQSGQQQQKQDGKKDEKYVTSRTAYDNYLESLSNPSKGK